MDPTLLNELPTIIGSGAAALGVLIVAASFSVRFALRPVMDAWLRSQQGSEAKTLQDRRINALEAELHSVQQQLHRLAESTEFERQLAASPSSPVSTLRPGVPKERE